MKRNCIKKIPYGKQSISKADIDAVVSVLKSDYITQGPWVKKFEEAVCDYSGAKYATACCNGTAALHLASVAAEIGPEYLVFVPAVTFAASATAAQQTGAKIEFIDVEPDTGLISVTALESALKNNYAQRKLAVITVDLAGHPCEMEEIAKLKEKWQFVWIHDACHSFGARWKSKSGKMIRVGEYEKVDMTVVSFHPVKNITTGEGGIVLTNELMFHQRLQKYRSHDIKRDVYDFKNKNLAFDSNGIVNPWYYEIHKAAFNYRITDIQAALGRSQLKRATRFLAKRRKIALKYRTLLENADNIFFPRLSDSVEHAFHLVLVLIDFKAINKTRAQVINELDKARIRSQVHYIPLPLMPCFKKEQSVEKYSGAMSYYEKALSLPCFYEMSMSDVKYISEKLMTIIDAQ